MATEITPQSVAAIRAEILALEDRLRGMRDATAAEGEKAAFPAEKPRFGTSGFLDPALEYFVRNELEKLEIRRRARIDTVDARLREHLEREFRKVIVWLIGLGIAFSGANLTIAKLVLFRS